MSDIYPIAVPKWGIEMVEGTITCWNKSEGDAISKGDEVFEMESDKIVNVWDSPVDGVLRRVLVPAGDAHPVGALLGVIADASVADNEIDAFILEDLNKANCLPPEQAENKILMRRLHYTLTGLPVPAVENKQFKFSEKLEELLNSPHYGEKWARHWMDVARYADSNGLDENLAFAHAWRYRDYLIDAFNLDIPFDEFIIEQLAGDLLPSATEGQKIASGFNRNHATTDEGGVIAEEFRVEYVVDRVKTTGNVWMGLTMECAQCHDHKYDPISQEEYFQFYAFYNNNADTGMQTRR